jgi:probable HAF family extracellular repeat protein
LPDVGSFGGGSSVAYGINDAGRVVGEAGTADGLGHAFITGPNGAGMTDLNSLVSLQAPNVVATAINNHGQLVISTTIPEPETYAMLFGLGLLGFIWRRRTTA